MPISSSSTLSELLDTHQAYPVSTWLDLLRAHAVNVTHPSDVLKLSPASLMQALSTLNVPAVLDRIVPLLNNPDGLRQALKPLKRSSSGYGHVDDSSEGSIITPLRAVLRPMLRSPKPQGTLALSSWEQQTQTLLMGLLLALDVPVYDQDWKWAVTFTRPYPAPQTPPPAGWLRRLIDHHAPIPTQTFGNNDTLLQEVARFPHHWPDQDLQALIDAGIPVDHQYGHATALGTAIARSAGAPVAPGQRGLAALLLNAGARPSLPSLWDGEHPVHVAADQTNAQALSLLLDHGAWAYTVQVDCSDDALADPSVRSCYHGMTPLHRASMGNAIGGAAIIDVLLDRGVPVDLPDAEHGNTALHWAVLYRQPVQIEHLLQRGASFDAVNLAGQRPVDLLDQDHPLRGEGDTMGMDPLSEEEDDDRLNRLTETCRALLHRMERERLLEAAGPTLALQQAPRARL